MPTHNRFFSLDHSIAQIEFNKTIAGCYRDGNAEYDSVGVLLLTWREDDMNCKEKEVNSLENVFKDKFNFKTEQYEIPPIETQQSLFNRLRAFSRYYDSPSKLGIIYYGGHAERKETEEGVDLELFARRSPHGVPNVGISRTNTSLSNISIPESPTETKGAVDIPLSKDRPEQPHISFKAICEQIRTAETDILLIVDSCFAAGAYTDQQFGGRKCELFCSIAEKDWARAPGQLGSFTKILTTTLGKMIEETPNGFSTSDLYRRVYQQQHQAHKPFHFTQSRLDFGRIWLRPVRQNDQDAAAENYDKNYTIDVRFHLTKSLEMTELNKVVKALQWIPYVRMVKMQNMHSPSDDLRRFTRTVHQANRLRPFLARIRAKLEKKRAEQLARTDSSPPSPVGAKVNDLFYPNLPPRDVGLFDWSKLQAVTPQAERLTAAQYFGQYHESKDSSRSESNNAGISVESQKHPNMAGAACETWSQKGKAVATLKKSLETERAASQPNELGQQENRDAPAELSASLLQRVVDLGLSQRTRDGILFFVMGVLAPTVLDWAVHGSASPFAAL